MALLPTDAYKSISEQHDDDSDSDKGSDLDNARREHHDDYAGIDEKDLNIAVAVMYALFVSMQPFGAALGRKIGMSTWVPLTMGIWGVCTLAHVWVRDRWTLVTLRGIIGCLE
ncbi:Mitogen-activated protein kinase, partial [Ascosphaera pollenicola]